MERSKLRSSLQDLDKTGCSCITEPAVAINEVTRVNNTFGLCSALKFGVVVGAVCLFVCGEFFYVCKAAALLGGMKSGVTANICIQFQVVTSLVPPPTPKNILY